jgi:putative membrane protein
VSALWQSLWNVTRGMLMGFAEIVPGVSGGTVALIVGVYHTVISGAASVVSALLGLVKPGGVKEARRCMSEVNWAVLIPVLGGMIAGIFVGAAVLEPVLETHPTESRAVFAGLILASLIVPIRMVGVAWSFPLVGLAALAGAASFVITGLPALAQASGLLIFVAPAAALAVCALVLPGVSGSFLLVTLGFYEPTLAAVNDRDVSYLGVFILGAIVGLSAFVRVLQWLLTRYRVITLVVMTGLMAGSLRALWPWQGEARELLPAPTDSLGVWLLVLAGVGVVAMIVLAERLLTPPVNPAQLN